MPELANSDVANLYKLDVTEAMGLVYGKTVHHNYAKQGGKKPVCMRYRVNGAIKLWKTRPDEFRIPIKHGLRGPHGYITELNYTDWHLESQCPDNKS